MQDEASVVIIGAGIIGSSIAYSLAKRGVTDVVLLDSSKAGSGSTSAALGGFRYQFSNELSIRLSQESIRTIENFRELTGYDPLVKHDGYVFIASTENSLSQLKRNAELAVSMGVPVDLLSHEDLQKRFSYYRFDGILGGTACMLDGHASTFAVHQGFISKAKEMGVSLYEDTAVTGISRTESVVKGVATARGDIRTKKVVIASGAYSGVVGNLAGVEIPIRPQPRKILVTHPFIDGIPLDAPIIIDVDSTLAIGREGKGVIFADNSTSTPGFDLVFPPDYDERIISSAIKRIPSLANATISYSDVGLYELSPDSNPIVCEIPEVEGLYCCSGFAGHGFMHSPAIGELTAELLTGSKPHLDISSFSIERFKGTTLDEGLII